MRAQVAEVDTPLLAVSLATAGSGSSVLYLHDVLFDHVARSGELPPLLDALAGSHALYAPALPGFFQDLKELSGFEDIRDYVFFLKDLIDYVPLDRPHLVGTGLGGWLAAELATFYPTAISTLTLINSFGIMVEGHPPARFFDAAAPNPLGGRREIRHLLFAKPEGDLAQGLMPDFPDDATNQEFFSDVHAAARIGWQPPSFYDLRLRSRLARITVPTHVVWAANNLVVDLDYARTYASEIRDAKLTVLDGAGHAIVVEKPEELAKTVTSFIDSQGKQ